jgi:flagellar motility protein MotE (MotC chaperone)
MKFRFLPTMIFAAVLMLSVRIGNIWDGVDGALTSRSSVGGSISVASALAQSTETPADSEAADQAEVDQVTADEDQVKADEGDAEAVSRLVTNDPTLLTQAEIDLLQRLADRRELLETQEKEMKMRDGLLQAAEERIDKKIAELKNFQNTIKKLIKNHTDQQVAKIKSLVKIYENMKPKDAARIFQELDMDTLLLVSEGMKERKLAPIMAKMNPLRATEITIELSRLRNLPDATDNSGG